MHKWKLYCTYIRPICHVGKELQLPTNNKTFIIFLGTSLLIEIFRKLFAHHVWRQLPNWTPTIFIHNCGSRSIFSWLFHSQPNGRERPSPWPSSRACVRTIRTRNICDILCSVLIVCEPHLCCVYVTTTTANTRRACLQCNITTIAHRTFYRKCVRGRFERACALCRL